ncbi:MAG TPA: carbohydrate binding domain-containing protein, partial [Oscillospiraceae bacterium]|nr:carbohydrate binding domain-containing protein [Oscillospiraceae bacterium]
MKKILAIILASLMLIMAGCSSKNNSEADSGLLTETEQETSAAQTEASEELAEKNDAESTEMIKNGDFGAGLPENWSTFTQGGEADVFIRDGQLVVSVKKTGSVDYGVQLYQDGFSLDQGCKYKMSFDAYSTIPRKIEYRVQLNGGDYHAYNSQIVDLTTSIQTYTFEFEMTEASDPAPRLAFNLGLPKGVDSLEPHEVMLDNIVLEVTDSSNKAEDKSQIKSPDISVDQIGYVSGEKKTVVFRGDNIDKT